MSSRKYLTLVGSLVSCAALSVSAQTQIPFNGTLTYSPDQFGVGQGGYGSGDIVIPGGATMSSTPLQLDVTLSQDVTLTKLVSGYDYGIGLGSFSPLIQPGDDAYTFAFELLENGTLITPTFAYDVANPFTFGFDENNPFNFPVDNLGTGYTTTALAGSLTFNEVDIQLTTANPSPNGVGITDFAFQLGAVPDSSNTLVLLSMGLLPLLWFGFGARRAAVARS